MLSDSRDLMRMRDAIVGSLRLRSIPPLVRSQTPCVLGVPDLANGVFATASAVPSDHWMLEHCFDVQHAAGTCRMGAADDPRSVVDPDAVNWRRRVAE